MRAFTSCLVLLASLAAGVHANCDTAILRNGACAVLFKEENCEGKHLDLWEGNILEFEVAIFELY